MCLINTGWTNCWGHDGGRKHLFQNPAPPQEEQLMSWPGSRRRMRRSVATMATAAPKINTLQSSHQLVCMCKRRVLTDICRLHPGPRVKQQTKYWPYYHPACQNPILGNTITYLLMTPNPVSLKKPTFKRTAAPGLQRTQAKYRENKGNDQPSESIEQLTFT